MPCIIFKITQNIIAHCCLVDIWSRNCLLFVYIWVHPCFMVGSVLLIILVFCVVCFACLQPASCGHFWLCSMIVHLWLPLLFSRTLIIIYTIQNNIDITFIESLHYNKHWLKNINSCLISVTLISIHIVVNHSMKILWHDNQI
jgi:hypothetical protein